MKYNWIKRSANGLLQLFYPRLCEVCSAELTEDEQIICLNCNMDLPRTSFHHIAENRAFQHFIGRVRIERATSFVYFSKEGMMQQMLHAFKYKGKKEIGRYLGLLFATELQASDWLKDIDLIIPVPLHSKKERQRGFNQAMEFALGITAAKPIALDKRKMIRTKNTETQTHKNRQQRIENVMEVFKVIEPELLEGKHILLVDDVLTTGATLEACAIELLKVKNVRVSIATIALAID